MNNNAMKRLSLPVLPALVVAGSSLNPAAALELGDIKIQSRLGEPLRASIAYALGPNEALADYCISLAPGAQINGMPNVGPATITVGDGVISLKGDTRVREPLMTARLSVNCPYTPQVTREFLLLVDPGESPAATRYAEAAPALATEPVAAAPVQPAAQRPAARRVPEPVAIGSSYRVQPGDSLSDIAERLEGRQVGLWQAVNAIFVANPDAFLNADPNQLKAGSLLDIPTTTALGAVAPTFAAASYPTEAAEPEPVAAPASFAVETLRPEPIATVDDTAYLEPATSTVYEPLLESTASPAVETTATAGIPELADIQVEQAETEPLPAGEAARPAAAATEPQLVVPAVPPAEPAPESAAPSAPARQSAAPQGSNYAVWWTLGGALALIGGIVAWRRRRFIEGDSLPEVAARAPHPMRRATDENSIEVRVISSAQQASDIDFTLSDDSPTEENLALDADLIEGHGLSEATAERVDFDFADTTDLDLELTEAATRELNEQVTDIIPPLRRDTGSILESEVLPEETEYDMSINMDATKMPEPDDVTGRDLQAVLVNADEITREEEGVTVNEQDDYEILEQDYEDEFTATQAFNEEIEKAARELATELGNVEAGAGESDHPSQDDTAALPLASVTDLDVDATMTAGNDDLADNEQELISELDDTGVNATLTLSLDTDAFTAELEPPADDVDFDDITANLEIKSRKGAG